MVDSGWNNVNSAMIDGGVVGFTDAILAEVLWTALEQAANDVGKTMSWNGNNFANRCNAVLHGQVMLAMSPSNAGSSLLMCLF